ncbi:ubiquinol-cytochrome c reductase, cytochrome c1, putative [Fulvimarina pelagi HTCC2506]|uniref:Cytochrome c1 n=1 Tax=Fulvimarina pelagi HTCC2506 TaxID=314231 RepID=Q0G7X2_9HYPH|nr:cytochrome c1 [Fulvimarina pelagi]EAU42242.1 ubiquinol-cytochrome c reductase, cytochrome c1, putative [Fulvimarina pelagi HTCC2506]
MKKTLSAILAAGIAFAPLAAFAQDGQGPNENTAQEEEVAAENADAPEEEAEEGHAETPHYPLRRPEEMNWSFAGPFGHWDVGQLQRGYKVYREVCAACHSMNFVAFRNLEDLGYSEEQVSTLAAEFTVQDGPDSSGEMFDRPATGSDYFPAPYPNPEAAAAANNGAVPPDLSLIAKARAVERGFPTFVFDIFTQYSEAGPDYLHALLTGYGEEPPEGTELMSGTYYNPYFISSSALAMPQPIYEDQVEYPDGAPQTVEQYSRDVTAFLMWAAEPHLTERKATGFVTMIFLIAFAVLMFFVKRRVWAGTPH